MIESKISQAGESAVTPVQRPTCPLGRILIVNEEPDLLRLHAEVLVSSGFEVDTAEDGTAGWVALHATRHSPESYNLLITDHDMLDLSGLTLVKKARAARMVLPVIMTTGRLPAEEFVRRYSWLQPMAALAKPYSIGQLLRMVEATLRMTDGVRERMAQPPNWPSALTLECLELFVASKINARPGV